jgi:membrane protease subunit HflK
VKRVALRALPVLVVALWIASGIYTVESEEMAVVKRFGKPGEHPVPSGIHWRLPWPIETHEKFRTTTVYKMGMGMITRDYLRGIPSPEELSLWLTGDTNILSVQIMIQYTVVDLADYLYRMEGAQFLMARVGEAVLTEVLGGMGVDDALTVERPRIAAEIRQHTQERLDEIGVGIAVNSVNLLGVDPPSQVIDVFRDVQNAASDRERIINEANGYANSVIPRARGEASWTIERAEADRNGRIEQASGDTSQFLALLEEYRKMPEATRRRLYLEAMEDVLPRVNRYVVDLENMERFDLRILDGEVQP